jgi:DNA-binding response OmpR family regulator
VPHMSLNVLIVDTDPAFSSALAQCLGSEGHDVTIANTGTSALARGRKQAPDIVLLEPSLPDADGYALARRFRAAILSAHSAILMVGAPSLARRPPEDEELVDLQLTKPIEAELLSGLMHYVLNRRRSNFPLSPR